MLKELKGDFSSPLPYINKYFITAKQGFTHVASAATGLTTLRNL